MADSGGVLGELRRGPGDHHPQPGQPGSRAGQRRDAAGRRRGTGGRARRGCPMTWRPSSALSDNAELPADPILARLLPDAYADDPERGGRVPPVHRGEPALRQGGGGPDRAGHAAPGGGRVRLGEADAQAWLRALNDVRLSLGVVLGVTDDFDEQVDEHVRRTTRARPTSGSTSGWPTSRRASSRRSSDPGYAATMLTISAELRGQDHRARPRRPPGRGLRRDRRARRAATGPSGSSRC